MTPYRKVCGEDGEVPGAFVRVLRELESSSLVEKTEDGGYTELRLTAEGRALMAPYYALSKAPAGLAAVATYLLAKPWLLTVLPRAAILAIDAVAAVYLTGLAVLVVMMLRGLLLEGLPLEKAPSGFEDWLLSFMSITYTLLYLA